MSAQNEISEAIRVWLATSLELSGIQQVVLARRLTDALERNISGVTILRMLSGQRAIAADEMLAAARICRVQLPPVREKKILLQPRLPGLDALARRAS